MKEKILIATLEKIFVLCGQEFLCPTRNNVHSLSKEEIVSHYEKVWSLINDIHNITFEAKQSINLLKTLNL